MSDLTTIPEKRCTKCNDKFPATSEYFNKDKRNSAGLRSECKSCASEYHRQYRQINSDKMREQSRQYYEVNSDKEKERYRCYYQTNSDKVKEKNHHYEKTNSGKVNARHRRYRQANLGKTRALNHNRRARKRNLPATFTDEQETVARRYFEGRCAICGRLPDFWHIVVMDHWIAVTDPRLDNPGTVAGNMIPMCHSKKGVGTDNVGCNNSKHDRDPREWVIARFGKKKSAKILSAIEVYFKALKEGSSHDPR